MMFSRDTVLWKYVQRNKNDSSFVENEGGNKQDIAVGKKNKSKAERAKTSKIAVIDHIPRKRQGNY